jgi:hypothetical protein
MLADYGMRYLSFVSGLALIVYSGISHGSFEIEFAILSGSFPPVAQHGGAATKRVARQYSLCYRLAGRRRCRNGIVCR